MPPAIYLNLDDAWASFGEALRMIDAREWGPHLRFSAPARTAETFFRDHERQLAPFVLYGSGDFHHLTALWIRRITEPVVVVSFDNHPDWDIRPPKWCCGSWVNRALELPHVQKVSVWGCGSFECWWPGQAFGNRRAEHGGRLDIHRWADDRPPQEQERRGAIFRDTWREQFQAFVKELNGGSVYVTIDLDCLRSADAATNWGNGNFSADDLCWALRELKSSARVIAGDLCGAFSPPRYARWKQRFVAAIDHPKLRAPDSEQARATNGATLEKLWPLLAD